MAKVTINEGLEILKQLDARSNELKQLRGQNADRRREMFGEKEVRIDPVYDVRALDQTVNRLAGERRKLSTAIKVMNQKTVVDGYEWSEDVLAAIETAAPNGTKAKRK